MKKLSLITIIMLLISLLAACSSGGSSNSASTEDNTGGANHEEAVEIEFWYGLGSVAGETMESIIADFNASQDEVVVKGIQQADYSETWQKVQAAIAAKNAPAVFIADVGIANAYGGEEGILQSLDEYMDAADFNKEDLLPVFTEPNIVDGKTYALPAYGTTQIMYFNKNVFEAAGVNPDDAFASWEKLAESSKVIQENSDAEFGHMIMWGSGNLVDLALSNGGQMVSNDGKEVVINSPEWVEAWEFARKNIHEEKTMGLISGGQGWEYWYKTIDQVMNGNAGGYTGSSGDRGDLDFSFIDAREQPGLSGNIGKPMAGALSMLIPKGKEQAEKDAAFKWMQYFTSPEVQAQWSMKIGYIPVRESTMEVAEYKKHVEENPYAGIPYKQALHASPSFIDPTGGKITDALTIAADKVELQNVPAKEALDEAQEVAQDALDEVNK
ncbi:ABC transporter substrate-binding protein [Robertmurraya massiliosenegalensis]|uniref:ABC transporter substrate-binding protein n=1 Tax=Robertmurraya massiliosenegalensis TaxID=1287657 RepID=UPI00031FE448|nr:ABC transporter substrate-binding protein [Robertmurraya massiliosenegalensis]